MDIGGLQKNSYIDFPGKISCVVFLRGCNFHCPYCHNPELIRQTPACPSPISADQLYAFLKARRCFLEAVVISGGEPTLQADLPQLCAAIKSLGYPIKLDTNGSHPQMLRRLIEKELVDFIAMDIKTAPHRYHPVFHSGRLESAIVESIGIIMNRAPAYEFRTTCAEKVVSERIIDAIGRLIEGADRYVLQCCRSDILMNPNFFQGRQPALASAEMERLKTAAERYVRSCTIR